MFPLDPVARELLAGFSALIDDAIDFYDIKGQLEENDLSVW